MKSESTRFSGRGRRRRARGERGSGSILAVVIVAAMFGVLTIFIPLYAVLGAKRAAAAAADSAALAAATVAAGIVPGVPCAAAASLAAAQGASLTHCESDGMVVTVGVHIGILGFDIAAAATAGPDFARKY
ncbi:MAG: Rv3654c family TadE-like protein [Lacisediminihabitans sp.]